MKPLTKKLLITSSCLMAAGALLIGAGYALGGWPGLKLTRSGLSSDSDRKEPYILRKTKIDAFTKADLNIGSEADIEILLSEDENFYLEYTMNGEYGEPVWDVSDDLLSLKQNDTTIGGIYFFQMGSVSDHESYSLRLYLPEGTVLSSLDIYNDFGSLDMKGIQTDAFSASLDYGNLNLSSCQFETADLQLDYGNLYLKQVLTDELDAVLDYGDLEMTDCRLGRGNIELSSGDLASSSSAADSLVVINEYGDLDLEQMTIRDADITLESGDLYFDAEGLESFTGTNEYGNAVILLHDDLDSYFFDLVTEFGELRLPESVSGRIESDVNEMHFVKSDGSKTVKFTAESGDIEVAASH